MYRIAEMSSTEIFIEKAFFSMKIIILIYVKENLT